MKHLNFACLRWFLSILCCILLVNPVLSEDDEDDDDDDDIPTDTVIGDRTCPTGQVWSAQWGTCIPSPTSSSGGTGSSTPDTSINDSEYEQSYPDCPRGEERNDDGECEFVIPDSIPKACHQHYENAMKYGHTAGTWMNLAHCI